MHREESLEKKLIEEIVLNGDKSSFNSLLNPYIKQMYNISYRLLNSEEDAKDVVQEALIKIYKNLKGFHMESKFFTWVYRITVNCAKDFIKAKQKNSSLSLDSELDESGEYLLYNSETKVKSPERMLEKKQLFSEIMETLNKLPINMRSAIVLRDVEGFSYSEIAEITGDKLNTVKSNIRRARELASKDLIKKGITPSSYERKYFYE